MEEHTLPPFFFSLSTQPCVMYIQAHTTHATPPFFFFFLLISLYQAAVVWWVRWCVLGKRMKWICTCCSSSGVNLSPKICLSLCFSATKRSCVLWSVSSQTCIMSLSSPLLPHTKCNVVQCSLTTTRGAIGL